MNRIFAMDLLRSIAMYLGVVLHSSIVYQYFPRPGWPKDLYTNLSFDFLYLILHSFRMQLFFLIAGFFACLLLDKIGTTNFAKHRLKRIVLPFAIGVIVLTPISSIFFIAYNSGFFEGNITVFKLLSSTIGWNGLFHLWFLYYLIIFYVATLVFRYATKWLNRFIELPEIIASYGFKHVVVYTTVLFCITYLFYDLNVEPWGGLKPRVNQFLYYGFFFGVGYFMYGKSNSLFRGSDNCYYYLLTGLVVSIFIFYFPLDSFGSIDQKLLFQFLISVQTIMFMFGLLGFSMRNFEIKHPIISYLSDASYWIYLIHFPLVTLQQMFLLKNPNIGGFKFWIVLVSTTIISLLTYDLFIRYTIVGEFLHGKKAKRKTSKAKLL